MKKQRLVWYPKHAVSDKRFADMQERVEKVKDKRTRELIYDLLYIVCDLDQRTFELRDQVGERVVRDEK